MNMPMQAQTEPRKAAASSDEPTPEERGQIVTHSDKALAMLKQLLLPPTPENYTLFFHYAMAINLELVREIDAAITNKANFSDSALKILYNKFIIANNNQRLIN